MTAHEIIRMRRMNRIREILKKAKYTNKPYDKERLIARCAVDWGATRRTILEYIKVVELTL
jgi:hypothetical protein